MEWASPRTHPFQAGEQVFEQQRLLEVDHFAGKGVFRTIQRIRDGDDQVLHGEFLHFLQLARQVLRGPEADDLQMRHAPVRMGEFEIGDHDRVAPCQDGAFPLDAPLMSRTFAETAKQRFLTARIEERFITVMRHEAVAR